MSEAPYDTERLKEFADRLEYGDDPMDVARDIRVLISGSIKACPCCGGDAEMLEHNHGQVQIRCTECMLATPMGLADDIIKAWNRRAGDE